MFSSQSAEHTLNLPCRRISAVKGDTAHHRFLVGTCILPYRQDDVAAGDRSVPNELHMLRFHEDLNELATDLILEHPTGEVWELNTHPEDRDLVLTVGGDSRRGVLWRMPSPPDDDDDDLGAASYDEAVTSTLVVEPRADPMNEQARLPEEHRVRCSVWNPDVENSYLDLVTLSSNTTNNALTLCHWDFTQPEDPTYQVVLPYHTNNGAATDPAVAWDPHNTNVVAVTHGTAVSVHDMRTDITREDAHVDTATSHRRHHRYHVTDLDYNPNRPHVMVTGGEDGLVKFWDLRNASSGSSHDNNHHHHRPIQISRGGHSHWITRVRYNPFHDQLVLSAGTDSAVNLWRISSVSSSPLLELDDEVPDDLLSSSSSAEKDDDKFKPVEGPDVRVDKMEHQESVYDVAWSKCDAWVWASVSMDGGVVLSHVPSKEKYKILL